MWKLRSTLANPPPPPQTYLKPDNICEASQHAGCVIDQSKVSFLKRSLSKHGSIPVRTPDCVHYRNHAHPRPPPSALWVASQPPEISCSRCHAQRLVLTGSAQLAAFPKETCSQVCSPLSMCRENALQFCTSLDILPLPVACQSSPVSNTTRNSGWLPTSRSCFCWELCSPLLCSVKVLHALSAFREPSATPDLGQMASSTWLVSWDSPLFLLPFLLDPVPFTLCLVIAGISTMSAHMLCLSIDSTKCLGMPHKNLVLRCKALKEAFKLWKLVGWWDSSRFSDSHPY